MSDFDESLIPLVGIRFWVKEWHQAEDELDMIEERIEIIKSNVVDCLNKMPNKTFTTDRGVVSLDPQTAILTYRKKEQ